MRGKASAGQNFDCIMSPCGNLESRGPMEMKAQWADLDFAASSQSTQRSKSFPRFWLGTSVAESWRG